jgi:hypothetical protein
VQKFAREPVKCYVRLEWGWKEVLGHGRGFGSWKGFWVMERGWQESGGHVKGKRVAGRQEG